jgi:hypothetical protein
VLRPAAADRPDPLKPWRSPPMILRRSPVAATTMAVLAIAVALLFFCALASRGDEPAPAGPPPGPAAPVGRIVIYRATPEGEEARPFRLYFLVEVPVAAPSGPPAPPPVPPPLPPLPPLPPPAPAPPAPEDTRHETRDTRQEEELRAAALAYGGAVPYRHEMAVALNALAAEVAAGGYDSISAVVAEVGRRRRPLGAAPPPALGSRLGTALDQVTRVGCKPDGTIADPAVVARALALAASALEDTGQKK